MLPKQNRLTTRGDFKGVFQGALRARSGPFNLVCRKNNMQISRFGFVIPLIVSKKAVQRNKLRRQLRDIIKHVLPNILEGYDCVIRAYPGASDIEYKEIEKDVVFLFRSVGFLK